jgi:hypothetical protein
VSLRLQLLAVGLLTLVLPWTGFRYVQEMETTLRAGLEQSLLARAATVATALAGQSATLCAPPDCDPQRAGATVYATALAREPEVDGVRDDHWNTTVEEGLAIGAGHRVWAGTFGRFVYLFISVADGELVYQRQVGQPPYGDRVVVAAEPGAARWWLMATAVLLTLVTGIDYVYRALALRRTSARAMRAAAARRADGPTGTTGARTDTAA